MMDMRMTVHVDPFAINVWFRSLDAEARASFLELILMHMPKEEAQEMANHLRGDRGKPIARLAAAIAYDEMKAS